VSQLRGGSYHYIENQEQIEYLFGDNFEAFLTPVAYDLTVRISPGPGLEVSHVFGVPEERLLRRRDGTVVVRASTVFFDANRSGLIVRLVPATGSDDPVLSAVATVGWSYTDARSNRENRGETEVSHQASNRNSLVEFKSADHYRGYALVNFAEMMKIALDLWHHHKPAEAVTLLEKAHFVLNLDAWITNDKALTTERALAEKLLAAMKQQPLETGPLETGLRDPVSFSCRSLNECIITSP
jgi:hypothetical protein